MRCRRAGLRKRNSTGQQLCLHCCTHGMTNAAKRRRHLADGDTSSVGWFSRRIFCHLQPRSSPRWTVAARAHRLRGNIEMERIDAPDHARAAASSAEARPGRSFKTRRRGPGFDVEPRYISSSTNPLVTSGGSRKSWCTSGPSLRTGSAACKDGMSVRSKNFPIGISSPH